MNDELKRSSLADEVAQLKLDALDFGELLADDVEEFGLGADAALDQVGRRLGLAPEDAGVDERRQLVLRLVGDFDVVQAPVVKRERALELLPDGAERVTFVPSLRGGFAPARAPLAVRLGRLIGEGR